MITIELEIQYEFDEEYRKIWSKDGKDHRDNNQPACYWDDGTIEWYIDGQFIRRNNL